MVPETDTKAASPPPRPVHVVTSNSLWRRGRHPTRISKRMSSFEIEVHRCLKVDCRRLLGRFSVFRGLHLVTIRPMSATGPCSTFAAPPPIMPKSPHPSPNGMFWIPEASHSIHNSRSDCTLQRDAGLLTLCLALVTRLTRIHGWVVYRDLLSLCVGIPHGHPSLTLSPFRLNLFSILGWGLLWFEI